MKLLSELIREQKNEVDALNDIVLKINRETISANPKITGALLTGSVARGDARIGPWGVMIDLALVVEDKKDIDLDEIFGKDECPDIPFHCVMLKDNIGLQIEVIENADLFKIRSRPESVVFAKNEAAIICDKDGVLKKWKEECFIITGDQIKSRALNNYFRFRYLCGEYRLEKWSRREGWIQIIQNFNEAAECYCNFLYCINKMFIPRKDWLTYLTFELENKPEKHALYMERLYTSIPGRASVIEKADLMSEVQSWMENYCKNERWL